jgi:hypothetical protein
MGQKDDDEGVLRALMMFRETQFSERPGLENVIDYIAANKHLD